MLLSALQVFPRTYDLVLNTDVNTGGYTQWFFFAVSNMAAGEEYTFHLVNHDKANSQFNFGMQPVVWSAAAHAARGAGWRRAGDGIAYFRNGLGRQPAHPPPGADKGPLPPAAPPAAAAAYYTASFTLVFDTPGDTCFVAYHFPYTYTDLQAYLARLMASPAAAAGCIARHTLCRTSGGLRCDLLTVTEPDPSPDGADDAAIVGSPALVRAALFFFFCGFPRTRCRSSENTNRLLSHRASRWRSGRMCLCRRACTPARPTRRGPCRGCSIS